MIANVTEIADIVPALMTFRRDLHAYPELGFCERRTAAKIAEALSVLDGMEVYREIGGTGVVGVLNGIGSGPMIGLRAEMDALPINEETHLTYASKHSGAFHGCGHDGHAAMLIGAAQNLARTRGFHGRVAFIFQPAEEGLGGARAMIEDGLFRRFPCHQIFALHNWPDLPIGTIGVRDGAVTAAADKFNIEVQGRGGHAAMPHLSGDVILAASALVQQLHGMVSRRVPPEQCAVLSVTQIHSGHTHNVLPANAAVSGTVRTFDPAVQDLLEETVHAVAAGVAAASGTSANVTYHRYYPMTINDSEAALVVRRIASAPPLGFTVVEPRPIAGGEDFSFMLREKPGCYFWLGSAKRGRNPNLHTPDFDFNDEVLPLGVALWTELVKQMLPVVECANGIGAPVVA